MNYPMSDHFSSPQWVDLVRGLLEDNAREAMDEHLREGCGECLQAYNDWYGLAAFAEEERGLDLPHEALRVAKSYLAQRSVLEGRVDASGRRRTWAPAVLATLVFDSRQALPAGVRASAAGYSRHLLFAARSLAIDLHLETASKPGWFLLAGQIADNSCPDHLPHRVELSLVHGDTAVSTFQTNEFGEFQCAFDRRKDLTLLFSLEIGAIALPLDVLFDPSNPLNSSTES
jgi:hypothetical protein